MLHLSKVQNHQYIIMLRGVCFGKWTLYVHSNINSLPQIMQLIMLALNPGYSTVKLSTVIGPSLNGTLIHHWLAPSRSWC